MKTTRLSAAIAAVFACASVQAEPLPHPSSETAPSAQDTGQAAPATDHARLLDQQTVRGTLPLPASGQSLAGDALKAALASRRDTASVLGSLGGVHVQTGGGLSGLPIIHGMAGDRNRIQVDGMDFIASCPNHMNPPLSYIDPAHVGSLTVFTATSPVSAGGDSIGGSVQVQSPAPQFAEGSNWQPSGEFGLRYHSNGNALHGDVRLALANDRWQLHYQGNHARAGNYRAASAFRSFTASGRAGHDLATDEVGSSGYRVQQHTLGLAFRRGIHLWQAHYALQDIPAQHYPNQRMDMLENRQYRWQLHYQASPDWGSLEARLWQERVTHVMGFGEDRQYWYGVDSLVPGQAAYTGACAPLSFTCAADMPMHTHARTHAASLRLNLALAEGRVLRLGQEYQRYRLDDWWPPSGSAMWPEVFWNIRHGRRDRFSLFAEWEGRLSPHWQALLGIRHSRIHTDAGTVQGYDSDPAPPGSHMMTAADAAAFNARPRSRRDRHLDISALLRWTPSPHLDVEAGLALKTRSPNLYERYAWSTWAMAAVMNNTHGDGNGYVGNIDLAPEKARTLALTWDWHAAEGTDAGQHWRVRLTPWHTRVRDYIDALPVAAHRPSQFQVLRYHNQSARLYGLDASAELPLAHTRRGDFRLHGTAQWQRGKNLATGHPLYQQMPANARLSLQHRHLGWESALEWQLVAAKREVAPLRNELPTHGYGLLHLRLGREVAGWRVDTGIENLLNRAHYLPTGGIYLGQGRTMAINGVPHGIPVPGMGRAFYLALRREM